MQICWKAQITKIDRKRNGKLNSTICNKNCNGILTPLLWVFFIPDQENFTGGLITICIIELPLFSWDTMCNMQLLYIWTKWEYQCHNIFLIFYIIYGNCFYFSDINEYIAYSSHLEALLSPTYWYNVILQVNEDTAY